MKVAKVCATDCYKYRGKHEEGRDRLPKVTLRAIAPEPKPEPKGFAVGPTDIWKAKEKAQEQALERGPFKVSVLGVE